MFQVQINCLYTRTWFLKVNITEGMLFPGKSFRKISLISEKLVALKQEWREEQISTFEPSLRGCGFYLQHLLQR